MHREFETLARRCALKQLFVAAAAGTSLAAMSADLPAYNVLKTPSRQSAKATRIALLAMTRAGRRFVAVGERGIVIFSDDEGTSWLQANVPVSVTLTAVQFVDTEIGWAVGHLGTILHTTDGGKSWHVQMDGIRAAHLVYESELQSAKEGGVGALLVQDGPDKPFFGLHFENARKGLVVGAYNLALCTEDGGATWRSLTERIPNPKGLHLYSLLKANEALFVAGEQGLLLRSVDQGESFHALASASKATAFGLVAGPRGEVLTFGLRGRAFLSRDSGATWKEVQTGTRASIGAGTLLANGHLLLGSESGELMLSRDNGETFRLLEARHPFAFTCLIQVNSKELLATTLGGVRKLALSSELS